MRITTKSLMVLAGLGLSGCATEAGFFAGFPPIGGATQPQETVAQPDAFLPADTTTDAELTASLSDAVDAALGAGEGDATAAESEAPLAPPAAPTSGDVMASDDGVLNLALSSQEEQRIARDADAAALAAAAALIVVIEPGEMPEILAGVNIIEYARATTNRVGERVVRRPTIKRRDNRRECARFDTADNAQRNFLANGGPDEDPLNLDPDGDGFACRWSPEPYRALVLE